jgi:hypothetical protein
MLIAYPPGPGLVPGSHELGSLGKHGSWSGPLSAHALPQPHSHLPLLKVTVALWSHRTLDPRYQAEQSGWVKVRPMAPVPSAPRGRIPPAVRWEGSRPPSRIGRQSCLTVEFHSHLPKPPGSPDTQARAKVCQMAVDWESGVRKTSMIE